MTQAVDMTHKRELYRKVPSMLTSEKRWVGHTSDKRPVDPNKLRLASVSNPNTWGTFDEALAIIGRQAKIGEDTSTNQSEVLGVGFMLGDGFIGIDVDDHGVPIPEALLNDVLELGTYVERSISGMGFHAYGRSSKSVRRSRMKEQPNLEIYTQGRYFIVTGDNVNDREVEDITEGVEMLAEKYFSSSSSHNEGVESKIGCASIGWIDIALERDSKLREFYNGKRETGDESACDLALLNKLAYWAEADRDAIREAFMSSPYVQTKDDEHKKKLQRPDYLTRSIEKACADLITVARLNKRTFLEVDGTWSAPEKLDAIEVPAFDLKWLPHVLASFSEQLANDIQVPIDFPAVLSLGALSLATANRFQIEARPGYIEPLHLYILLVAAPSERKSGVLREVMSPIVKWEESHNAKNAVAIKQNQTALAILQKKLSSAQDVAAKHGNKNSATAEFDAAKLSEELAKFNELKHLRLIASDVTPEAILSLMSANNGWLGLVSGEGGLFDSLNGRYQKSDNFDVLLKAFSAEEIRLDRVGRAPELVSNPALTLIQALQPTVLEKILSNPSFVGRGLISRLLFCYPKSRAGTRTLNEDCMDSSVRESYHQLLTSLLKPRNGELDTISLSSEAYDVAESFYYELEKLLAEGAYSVVEDFIGKLFGLSLRFAGLLHIAQFSTSALVMDVGKDTMLNAISLAKYFLGHALKARQTNGDLESANALRILKRIKSMGVTNRIDRRSLHRCFQNMEGLDDALGRLEEHGYLVREVVVKDTRRGKPGGPTFLINPAIWER